MALQTTLLGLAIVIILALLVALVGPLVIDWGGYRSAFEGQATRLIGLDVRVAGEIDARLLPSPRLTLHDIDIGRPGENRIRARALGIEFALGPLMRGEWRAAEMHLVGPQLKLGLDGAGRVKAPDVAIRFNPDALSIDRLSIQDGKVTLADAASGASLTLDRLWFNGEARSLLGPYKGEGAATIGGDLYPFRIAVGRYGDDEVVRLHVNVDPVNHPLNIEADGALTLGADKPGFEGSLSLTRPVGIASRGADQLTQPWRVSGKIKASAASALMQKFEFQYGSETEGFALTGVADFKFGKHPRFDGVLSGRQIDLDRAVTGVDGASPLPAAAIRRIAQLAGSAFRPAIPVQIGIGIDQVTIGGNTIANLRGDITTGDAGWKLDGFEFRAPGFTQVRLSGNLTVDADGVRFRGPAEINAGDPKLLTAWLQGRTESGKGDRLRPLNLRGEITLGSDEVAVEGLKAEFDRKTITGRLVYLFAGKNRQTKLDAELKAPEIDIDAALGFGKAMLSGATVEWPKDMTIAADIGHATFAGLDARGAEARLKINAGGLQIDRLLVTDLGGGAFSANGRIDTSGKAPRGSVAVDFETRQTAAIAALVAKFSPRAASPASSLLDRATHAKFHATLDVTGDKDMGATLARFAVAGDLDTMRFDARARMTGDWAKPSAADLQVDAAVDAPDGATLINVLGLERFVAAGEGPGQIKLQATGPADRDLKIDWKLTAGGLAAQGAGRGRVSLDQGAHMTATLAVEKADLRPLRPGGGMDRSEALPFSMASRVAIDGRNVKFDDIDARLGQSGIRGHLSLAGVSPRRVDGALETDAVDAAALIARAIGMPAQVKRDGAAWTWSSEPFGSGVFGNYAGRIALKARRVELLPHLAAREFRAALRLGKDGFALDDMVADMAGGRFAGGMSFHGAEDGLTAHIKVSLAGADTAGLLSSGARPPVTGTLALSAEVKGNGLSPIALIGSLQGTGKFALSGAQFAGLDPRAFDAVTQAVDRGLAIDAERITDVVNKALDSGQLSVERIEGAVALSAGQVRLSNVSADGKGAKLSLAGTADLTDGSIDARLLLSGAGQNAGTRPDVFLALKGPLMAPVRSVDVSALTGWLTLRAIDNQAKQLRAIEESAAQSKPTTPVPKVERAPALPAPVVIKPLPLPRRVPSGASIGPQN